MMTVTAKRLADGKTIALDKLMQIRVTSTLSSPAQGLSLEAVVDSFPGELGQITVQESNRTIFTGTVDSQTESISVSGRRVRIDARSKAALLLDNEAVPSNLVSGRLSTVFNRFIAPYGFSLYNTRGNRALPLYVVNKGLSEWEAFSNFVRRAYGCTPHVMGNQVVIGRPGANTALVVGGAGLPYTRLEHTFAPYNMISKIVLRDADGYYRSAVHNSRAAYYGVQRKRYIIPATEFIDAPGLDGNQRLRRSMLRLNTVTVELPGIVQALLGQEIRLVGENLDLSSLIAEEIVYNQDQNGITTTLSLVRSIYYE